MGHKMKKNVLIETILILTIAGISFWNIQQQQENVSLRKSEAVQEERQKALKKRQEELQQENDRLSKNVTAFSEELNKTQKDETNTGVDLNSEFINVVTKLFEANINFTPENYADRKKEVSSYLSEELHKEYFGKERITYQDANKTTSQLISLEIYSKELQNNDLEGLVVVFHRSKQINHGWIKGMNIFKVSYRSETRKFVRITNLGSGYSS